VNAGRPALHRYGPAALRWGVAALLVLGAHGTAGWAIATWQRAEAAPGATPAAVMIELAPLAVAPEAPQQDLAPGPEMVEAQPEPEPPKPIDPPKEVEPPPPEEPEPAAVPQPDIKIPELPPLPDAAATLAPPPKQEPPPKKLERKPPPKPKVVERKKPINPDKPRAERTSAPTAQAQIADRVAAPASGASSASPAAAASWRGSLIAHLNRFKRFPSGATPGTVQVAFSIDRGGRVTSARLVRGSGDAALDEEAVAMIRRASPVPAPPDGLGGGGAVSLSVPIRFSR
jgi:protein TonB